MITPKHERPLIYSLVLLFIATPLFAQTEGLLKSYPLPPIELEKAITNWFTRTSFEICRTPLKMGQTRLTAVKASELWEVTVMPNTPLAARVQAQYTNDGEPDKRQLETLWSYLEEYVAGDLRGSSMNMEIGVEDTDYVIPTAVLSQLESVVCIVAKLNNRTAQFSGAILDEDGLIVCTAHDLDRHQKIIVTLHDGRQFNGKIVKTDPHRDLALLHVNGAFMNFASLEDGRNLLRPGERLYSIDCSMNGKSTIHPGVLIGPPRKVNDLPLWQVNMEIHPGSSGSPVFDVQGNLVAVVKGRYRGTHSIGFLIPLETIIGFVVETGSP